MGLVLESGVLTAGFAALEEAEDEPDDAENDEEDDKDGKPERADKEEVLEGVGLVEEDDGLGDAIEADWEGAGVGEVPVKKAGTGGAGEDNESFGERGFAAVLILLKDFVVGKEVADGEGLAGIEVDVAGVFDGGGSGEGVAKDEAGEVMSDELGFFAQFPAFDVAIEYGGGTNLDVEGGVGLVFRGIVVLVCCWSFGEGVLDHDGGVLSAVRGVRGNIDDELRVGRFAGFEAVDGFWEAEPVFEIGIGIVGREVRVIAVVVDVIGGGFEAEIEGEAANVGDRDGAFVMLARSELDDLLRGTDGHDEVAGFKRGDRGRCEQS